MIVVFFTGLCKIGQIFVFSKIMLFLLVLFLSMTFFSSLFACTCTNYIRIIYELYDFDSRHSNVIRSFIQSAVLTLPSSSHLIPNHPNPVQLVECGRPSFSAVITIPSGAHLSIVFAAGIQGCSVHLSDRGWKYPLSYDSGRGCVDKGMCD